MKQHLSLQELATQITERAGQKEDFVADTRTMAMTIAGDTIGLADGQDFSINPLAHRQIAERLDIPFRYYDRMRTDAPELLAQNVNSWFTNKPARRMLRTLGGSARAFLSDSYARMDDDAFAEVVLPVVHETAGAKVVSCGMDEERTHIKFVSERIQRDVKVGDPVQFGIAFSNSEVGQGRLQGALLVYQLKCLNGAVSEDDMFGARHLGGRLGKGRDLNEIFKLDTITMDAKATILKLRDFAADVLSERSINAVLERMRGLAAMPINKPAEAVEKLAKQQGFSEGEKESVLAHLIRGGDLTAWGLQNAVTAAAQDDAISYSRASELEKLGGKMLTLTKTDYRDLALAA